MVVRKFNYYRFFIFIVILISLIVGSIILINRHNYKKTYDYKLSVIGYSEEEIELLKNKLDNNKLDELLNKDYNSYLVDFLNEKYYIYKNIDKYIEYKKLHKTENNSVIVSLINTEANIDWIDNMKETDVSKGYLMLVNRIYGLPDDYEVEDIVKVPVKYAYSGVKISNSILESIEEMIDDAKEEGYTFVLSDGYRSNSEQTKLYNRYKDAYGISETDKIVARPGHSEYETGISFNIVPYNKVYDNPKESDEYKWLYDNAYKYGFIFRLPDDKIKLTGFDASTWRLRYVGKDAAKIIYDEKICFEEYYAYYIDKE